ncbi:hypothetical protein ND925_09595 [Vibrio diabolicus]|uniref:hypothetical protein n=1 Tax=Vibrio harveyi group TaxID=717610 RepID=UPI0013031AA1|nr:MULTISPECIES: hypothetical protein [Vibrio harveyi group]MCS0383033.1 hypothetical protein [Vibrio diabolicus]
MFEDKTTVMSGLYLGTGKTKISLLEQLAHILGEPEQEDLKGRLDSAIRARDYLTIKDCLVELRAIIAESLGFLRLSLALLRLTRLIADSFLSKYKANLEIPPTSRLGHKVDSFPPHICIYV